MEQRQPVLHAGIAAALAHRLVEQIVRVGGAEGLHIAGAEAADGLGGELELRDRHEVERAQLVGAALGLGIEGADRFQRVAEEIEPHRIGHAGRKQVDDAAAHRIFAGLAHRRGAHVAVELEPAHDAVHGEHVAGRGRQRLAGDERPGGHALDDGIDGGEQHRGPRLRPACALSRASRDSAVMRCATMPAMRRGAVIGLAIPGREFERPRCRARRRRARA